MGKKEVIQAAVQVGKSLSKAGPGLAGLMPKGGVHHPDSSITKGSNRSLYISGRGVVSPVPGMHPVMGKNLLTGSGLPKRQSDGLEKLREIQRRKIRR